MRLRCSRGRVEHLDAFAYLAGPPARPFDVVFLDPPYAGDLLAASVPATGGGRLAARRARWSTSRTRRPRAYPSCRPGWQVLRSKRAGDVGYHLARRPRLAQQEEEARGEV